MEDTSVQGERSIDDAVEEFALVGLGIQRVTMAEAMPDLGPQRHARHRERLDEA